MNTATVHPAHDRRFVATIMVDLAQHFGQWRQLTQLYAGHVETWERSLLIRDAIVRARRVGYVIEGDKRLGYRLIDIDPPLYVHAESRLAAPLTEDEAAEVAGQLSIDGVEG